MRLRTVQMGEGMKRSLLLVVICCAMMNTASAKKDSLLKLWYNHPAKEWVEALPIGNGRLGAMVYGDPCQETIQLNESTVWGGQPNRNDNPDAREAIPGIRKLIFEGKYKEAQDLANRSVISKISSGMPYQTVGELHLMFPGHEGYTDYSRELDIGKAVVRSHYNSAGVSYEQTAFASFPDQVIVVRIAANKRRSVSFSVSMGRPAPVQVSTEGNSTLTMSGVTGDCDSVKGKVQFQAKVKIVAERGSISAGDNSLSVTNADAATIYISIASSVVNYADISADAGARADQYLRRALKKTYVHSLCDNVEAFQHYFNRVQLDLGVTDSVRNPTDVRIAGFAGGNDPQLAALYFQFGRYLLISCSQPGGQPANLQGLWNNQLYPPWDSKYTVNINAEMNYWPSEVTNLTEMNDPLVQMIRELSVTGRQTAEVMYGAKGWVLHHNTDLWRINGPVDGSFWGMWPMGGAWLCQHLWEKYEFNADKKYLESVYPIMKGAVEFYLSTLVSYPGHDWLVVSPSVSPENSPTDHPESSISAGTTLDNQLLFDLFTKTEQAAKILDRDKDFVSDIEKTLKRLPPMQIGQHAQLQEWIEDWDNPEDHHRHVSHLYGVFPSNQVSPFRTPELFDAARRSLVFRGDPSTGWSMNWKINLWAKLLDGNHALKLIKDQIQLVDQSAGKSTKYAGGGGTYPNMFDAHPPFQIDGNFGFASGIAEMLLQSDDGAIFVLPALPDAWPNGSVKGLCARGGFEIENLQWKNDRISKLVIKSKIGGICRLRSYWPLKGEGNTKLQKVAGENPNVFYRVPDVKVPLISSQARLEPIGIKETYLYDIPTETGRNYVLVPAD